jgi:uncharacterized protein (UPF0335 family)
MGQSCFHFLENPSIGRLEIAVVSIESTIEDVLDQAATLSNGIDVHMLKIAVR